MVYLVLLTGLFILIYSLFLLGRGSSSREEGKPLPRAAPLEGNPVSQEEAALQLAFQDYITGPEEAVEGKLLYELKEKVEVQLSELVIQRELVTDLMMRVEKKLDSQPLEKLRDDERQEKMEQKKGRQQNKDSTSLNEDALDRARLHNDVYLLNDQGIPLVEIAKQVGLGKGEVELILGLRK